MKILKNKNIKSFIHMLAAYKKQHIVAMIFSVFYSIFMLLQPIILMSIIDEGIMKKNLRNILIYMYIFRSNSGAEHSEYNCYIFIFFHRKKLYTRLED